MTEFPGNPCEIRVLSRRSPEKPYKIVYLNNSQDPSGPDPISGQKAKKSLFYKHKSVQACFMLVLMLGLVYPPYSAKASFLSSIIGNQASAKTVAEDKNLGNSQTVALLEATPTINPKFGTGGPDVEIQDDNSLVSEMGPLGTAKDVEEAPVTDEIELYVVKKGDSVASIAKLFNISTATLRSANDLKVGDPIKEGMVLLILPVDGITYTIKKNDTLSSIAKKFNVDADDIGGFNGITNESALAVGNEIIIPGGKVVEVAPKPVVKKVVKTHVTLPENPGSIGTDVAGYYMRPVAGCPITQGQHDRYAVDFGCPTGTSIRAAAEGTVILSKGGYNGGFGNLIVIQHPNGTQTFYAHQSVRIAQVGDHVNQGDVIGKVGSTGRSTGPHLHFEVRGARNPWFSHRKGSTD